MYGPKTRELDFEEFSYVNEQGEFHLRSTGWAKPLSTFLFDNFRVSSISFTPPYIIVFCENKVPPPSERPFKIAGMVAVWVVEGEVLFPEDIEMGQLSYPVVHPTISLNQDLLDDLQPFIIPKAKTLSAIMNEYFPDALAISFVSHQIIIELKKATDEEFWKQLDFLPIWISGTEMAIRYYNGPLHGRELDKPNRPEPKADKLRDEYDGTDYLKSQGCFHPGSMMSRGDNTIFTAGIQVKRQQDIGVTVPVSCWDKKFENERRPGKCTVNQGDLGNGTKFQVRTKRVLESGTRVATTDKPFNNRFTNLKGFASNLLHSDDIRKVNELFWTDNFVTGPQQLASIGKRVCKVDTRGNDLFSDPDAPSVSPEYGELVQCIYASSMPPINRQQKIQDGVCGAPIVRARKEELLNPPRTRAKVLALKTGEPSIRRPAWNAPLRVLQKRLPQEETTGEVAGFMDIQYGGDRLLCFADVVDGLVEDGWSVVPVCEKREFNTSGLDGNSA